MYVGFVRNGGGILVCKVACACFSCFLSMMLVFLLIRFNELVKILSVKIPKKIEDKQMKTMIEI